MSKRYHNLKKPPFSATSKERLLVSEELDDILFTTLNEIHGASYSGRFWKIIIAPYISVILRNMTLLENKNLLVNHSKYANPNMFQTRGKFISYDKIRHVVKVLGSLRSYNKIINQFRNAFNIGTGFHYPKAILSEVDIYMDSFYPFLYNKKTDAKKRDIVIKRYDNFSEIFLSNIIKFIPKIYIEYFDHFMNLIPLFEPERKIFHVSMLENPFIRFSIAKYTEHGAQLKYYQHGGFYGEYKYHNAHHYESSISDEFMSWGWKMKTNDTPSKAFRLEKFRLGYNNQNEKSFDLLMVYPILNGTNRAYFTKLSSLFFDTIDQTKYAKVCARLRPTSRFNRKSELAFISEDVDKIDSGYEQISTLVSKSKLALIINYPSTTMLECLYVDQPVIALLNNDDPSDIVQPHYDLLLEKGLFHLTLDSLVEHLNTMDIDMWWQELIKDSSYIEFKHEFLREV